MEKVLELVRQERVRQQAKYPDDRNLPPLFWHAILSEEVGEVARGILEGDHENVKEELIQVAAVAIAWLVDIEHQEEKFKETTHR